MTDRGHRHSAGIQVVAFWLVFREAAQHDPYLSGDDNDGGDNNDNDGNNGDSDGYSYDEGND